MSWNLREVNIANTGYYGPILEIKKYERMKVMGNPLSNGEEMTNILYCPEI